MHSHNHHHHVEPQDFGAAFQIGIVLNIGFVVVEFLCGLWFSSVSLLADAGHNLSDVFGLLIAYAAFRLAELKPTQRFTYGLGSSTIMASTVNGAILLVAVGMISWEAIQRFYQPAAVQGLGVVGVAAVGVLINAATAALFFRGRSHDLNVKGAYLHMLADAIVSVGVVVAGLAIWWTDWLWIDPAVSLVIAAVIFYGTWGLFRDSMLLLGQGVPREIDLLRVQEYLESVEGIDSVHDLHVWALSTTRTAMTSHLVCDRSVDTDKLLKEITETLFHQFQIHHATLQIETAPGLVDCDHFGGEVKRGG